MNELEELEQEGLDEQLLEVGGTADLPSVPATELPAAPGQLLCQLKCCLVQEILFIRERKTKLNTQADSICARVFI